MIEKVQTQSSKHTHNHYEWSQCPSNLNLYTLHCRLCVIKKKAIISHTQKINTVHVLESFLAACLLFSQCIVDYDAMPFSNTWGHYCTSGVSRFIQRIEVVLI